VVTGYRFIGDVLAETGVGMVVLLAGHHRMAQPGKRP